MSFKVDHQTIGDLKIIGGAREQDVYGLFNRTKTRGGAAMLKDMFLYPRSREEEITGRVNIIRYFKEKGMVFPFQSSVFDTIEHYLGNTDERTRLSLHEDNLQRKFNNLIGSDTDYQQLNKGAIATLSFFVDLKSFLEKLGDNGSVSELNKDVKAIQDTLSLPDFSFFKELDKKPNKLSYSKTAHYDKLLRFTLNKEIQKLLYHVYGFDVYIAVAETANTYNFSLRRSNTRTVT